MNGYELLKPSYYWRKLSTASHCKLDLRTQRKRARSLNLDIDCHGPNNVRHEISGPSSLCFFAFPLRLAFHFSSRYHNVLKIESRESDKCFFGCTYTLISENQNFLRRFPDSVYISRAGSWLQTNFSLQKGLREYMYFQSPYWNVQGKRSW